MAHRETGIRVPSVRDVVVRELAVEGASEMKGVSGSSLDQKAVLDAIRRGHIDYPDVKKATGMETAKLTTALTRLAEKNLIRRDNGRYELVGPFYLQLYWTRSASLDGGGA